MRDLKQMLKVTAIYASGPDDPDDPHDNEGSEFQYNFEEDTDEDFIGEDQIDDEFQWLAWAHQEDGIVEIISWRLQASDDLSAQWRQDKFWISLNGEQHLVPLSIDTHNTYILVSSLAYLLKENYDFWLVKYLMDDDRHALLITTKEESKELTSRHSKQTSRFFTPLILGHDYFSGIDIPYLSHEDHNPLFKQQSDAIAPIITRILKEITHKGVQQIEDYKQREAWLEQLTGDDISEISAEEMIRKIEEFSKKDTQTHEEFTQKINRLRQEVTQIVENSIVR